MVLDEASGGKNIAEEDIRSCKIFLEMRSNHGLSWLVGQIKVYCQLVQEIGSATLPLIEATAKSCVTFHP